MFWYPFVPGVTDVQPIPPSQIVGATESVGKEVVQAGGALADSLALMALVAAGLFLLLGIGLAAARITTKVLKLGAGIFLGVLVMYVLMVYPDKVVGLIHGFLEALFKNLGSSSSSTTSSMFFKIPLA
ncbi:MAG TPA: hypothetical protein DEA47_01050 [Peptococcaceae bacterium]|nr:MAG: hypothetical protein XD50_0277 [Clostridia bacterium 41_269]HBT19952.1 hypothetical protein [Peptococcaceae bacterium]